MSGIANKEMRNLGRELGATPENFEEAIRRLARELWPHSGGDSAILIDGRERDGVFITPDTVHIIEVTTERKKQKVEDDLKKSIELKNLLSKNNNFSSHNYKIWIITRDEPTADQSSAADDGRRRARCPVVIMSGRTFQSHLVNASDYLVARRRYPFGSIRSLDATQSVSGVPASEYVPLDLLCSGDNKPWTVDAVALRMMAQYGLYLLLGDFGGGKSMTMRYWHSLMEDAYFSGRTSHFPIYLNLRDHIGQDKPASALYDHAQSLGLRDGETLVRAWRAGFVHLILDGFDEMASSRFRGGPKGLRATRRKAMTIVRNFITEHPHKLAALMVGGRDNYFEDPAERLAAMGLSTKEVHIYNLTEFSPDQINMYLSRLRVSHDVVPDWLPSRPLLIGYLARRQILTGETNLRGLPRSDGWDFLLDRICEREGTQIDALGGAVGTVRPFVERLATLARETTTGRGPISVRQMTEVFESIVGATADDASEQLLLRMAGLAPSEHNSQTVVSSSAQDNNNREFVDEDLADVARAGDVTRFIINSHDENLNNCFNNTDGKRDSLFALGDVGLEVAVHQVTRAGITPRQISAALRAAIDDLNSGTLAYDILRVMQLADMPITMDDRSTRSIVIKDIFCEEFAITQNFDLSNVHFRGVILRNLNIETILSEYNGPYFDNSLIESVSGVNQISDLPTQFFRNTQIESLSDEGHAVRNLRQTQLRPAERVLLVTLRRLFLQSWKGRKESAFPRGLSDQERTYVSDVLALVKSEGLAEPHKLGGATVWMPNRTARDRAMCILNAPQTSDDELALKARAL